MLELSRYQHLGAAGTIAHVDGMMMVIRRNQIDELQKSISFQSQDLYEP